jgi:hypothetical protein
MREQINNLSRERSREEAVMTEDKRKLLGIMEDTAVHDLET